jgi:SNF2 family DNA or RNA helicase
MLKNTPAVVKNSVKYIIELNDKSPMVDANIDGLKDITLMLHQRTVVYSMLELENIRRVVIPADGRKQKEDKYYQSSALVLSEAFGSGKTYDILAMILLRPIPKAIPEIINVHSDTHVYRHTKTNVTIRKLYTSNNALIRPNLIVVGGSVLNQWMNVIKNHTNLKMFIISDCFAARTFNELIKNNKINHYDVVLAKNGYISAHLDGFDKEYNSIISVINKYTGNRCWSRVFYDDFDTIRIPPDAYAINALFTVYVSATEKRNSASTPKPTGDNIIEYINSKSRIMLNGVANDNCLMKLFNVRNNKKFINESTSITRINQYRYVYKNPDDNFIRLIGALGDDNTNTLIEMLNGDAINTAADTVGIKTKSIADIFQRVLDNKYNDYIKASHIVNVLNFVRTEVLSLLNPHPKGKQHPQTKLQKIRTYILNSKDINIDHIHNLLKYHSGTLIELINALEIEAKKELEETGKAITRVMDNAKEGMCQICCAELNSIDTFIMKCCGIILCDACGVHGTHLKKGYDRKSNQTSVVGSCANCRASVRLDRDFIFLNKNFSLEDLLNAKGTETDIIDDKPAPVSEPDKDEITNPKLNALLKIIRGEVPPNREKCDIKIERLLEGVKDIQTVGKKVVVFAAFNETLHLIEEFLCAQGIDYLRLGGTHNEIERAVNTFRDSINVLLINSRQQCAGLNLEFCDHMVLFHHITDKNVIGQVVARGQRMKRKSNLQLHFLQYNNEEYLTRN